MAITNAEEMLTFGLAIFLVVSLAIILFGLASGYEKFVMVWLGIMILVLILTPSHFSAKPNPNSQPTSQTTSSSAPGKTQPSLSLEPNP